MSQPCYCQTVETHSCVSASCQVFATGDFIRQSCLPRRKNASLQVFVELTIVLVFKRSSIGCRQEYYREAATRKHTLFSPSDFPLRKTSSPPPVTDRRGRCLLSQQENSSCLEAIDSSRFCFYVIFINLGDIGLYIRLALWRQNGLQYPRATQQVIRAIALGWTQSFSL